MANRTEAFLLFGDTNYTWNNGGREDYNLDTLNKTDYVRVEITDDQQYGDANKTVLFLRKMHNEFTTWSSNPLTNMTIPCWNISDASLPQDVSSGIRRLCVSSISTGITDVSMGVGDEGTNISVRTESYNWLFLLLTLIVIAGGLGNVLVCLATCLERRLQNVTNYFLFSLAVADLLVCVAVMPFGIVDQFYGRWPFGWQVCNVWVTCDVLSCSSSIIHMCFISLGRYLGIRNPLKTRSNSKKAVVTKIVLVWLLSMVITSPITVLAIVDTTNIQPTEDICAINNRFFFVFGSMFAFYIPMIIMVTTYVLTVQLLQQKAKFLAERPAKRVQFSRRLRRSSIHKGSERCRSPHRSLSRNGHVMRSSSSSSGGRREICDKCGNGFRSSTSTIESADYEHLKAHPRCNTHPQITPQSSCNFQMVGGMIRTLGRSQVMNEQKATKVLGIVFFMFVICWAPFFVLNILFAVMDPEQFPGYLATTFLWLGYASSTINPIIYTIFNRTFKRAFWKLITCRCTFSGHVRSRSTNYTSAWTFKTSSQYSMKGISPQQTFKDSVC